VAAADRRVILPPQAEHSRRLGSLLRTHLHRQKVFIRSAARRACQV